jgi:hypothetical protein
MCVCVFFNAFAGLDNKPTSKFVHIIRLALAIART